MAADNAFSFAIVTASPKGRMLERMLAKVLNCYKFVWLLSILKIVSGKKREYISFKEMSARMIATAWYPVIYFRLNLGYADSLADAIHDVKAECGLPDGAKYDEIVRAVMAIKNEKLVAQIEELTEYVCPRFIVPVFSDELEEFRKTCGSNSKFDAGKNRTVKELSQKEWNRLRTPYVIGDEGITLTPEWTQFFHDFNQIIAESTYFKLTQYIQRRNPSVPAISEKLIQPTKRSSPEFDKARDYWSLVIDKNPDVYDIYTMRHFTKDALDSLGPMSVDHFVPWKFVLHDQIWNLVPTFRSPNSSKSDNLPDFAYLDDFCSVQFLGLSTIRRTNQFSHLIEAYRDVIPDAEKFVAILENKDVFSLQLKNAIIPLLLQAKNQGFSDWNNSYREI